MRFVIALLAIALTCTSCTKKPQEQNLDVEFGNLAEYFKSYVPEEFEESSYPQYLFQYREKIEGYTVKFAVLPTEVFEESIYGLGTFYFIDDDLKQIFRANNLYLCILKPNDLKEDTINVVDYDCPEIDYSKPVELRQFCHLPFVLLDADFDGRKELLMNLWGQGPMLMNSYEIIKLEGSNFGNEVNDCVPDEKLNDTDSIGAWFSIDYLTELDYENKEIIMYAWAFDTYNKYYYQIVNGKPILKKEETDLENGNDNRN